MDNNNNLHDRVHDKAQELKNDIKEKKDDIVNKFTCSKQNGQKSYDKQDDWKQNTPHDEQEGWNQNQQTPYGKEDSEKKQAEQSGQYDPSQHTQN